MYFLIIDCTALLGGLRLFRWLGRVIGWSGALLDGLGPLRDKSSTIAARRVHRTVTLAEFIIPGLDTIIGRYIDPAVQLTLVFLDR